MKDKITKETTLAEIFKNQRLIEVLKKHNLPCLGCPLAKFEIEALRIGQVCKMYAIDIRALLKELNSAFKREETQNHHSRFDK